MPSISPNRPWRLLCLQALILSLVGGTIVFILGNSMLSGAESRQWSLPLLQKVNETLRDCGFEDITITHFTLRKGAHFLEFGLLGFLFAMIVISVYRHTKRWFLSAPLLIALILCVADEYIQTYTGRNGRVRDIVIDFAGVVSGFLPAYLAVVWSYVRQTDDDDDTAFTPFPEPDTRDDALPPDKSWTNTIQEPLSVKTEHR